MFATSNTVLICLTPTWHKSNTVLCGVCRNRPDSHSLEKLILLLLSLDIQLETPKNNAFLNPNVLQIAVNLLTVHQKQYTYIRMCSQVYTMIRWFSGRKRDCYARGPGFPESGKVWLGFVHQKSLSCSHEAWICGRLTAIGSPSVTWDLKYNWRNVGVHIFLTLKRLLMISLYETNPFTHLLISKTCMKLNMLTIIIRLVLFILLARIL